MSDWLEDTVTEAVVADVEKEIGGDSNGDSPAADPWAVDDVPTPALGGGFFSLKVARAFTMTLGYGTEISPQIASLDDPVPGLFPTIVDGAFDPSVVTDETVVETMVVCGDLTDGDQGAEDSAAATVVDHELADEPRQRSFSAAATGPSDGDLASPRLIRAALAQAYAALSAGFVREAGEGSPSPSGGRRANRR